MGKNAHVVTRYMDCFGRQDWPGLIELLTDDVERWEIGAPAPTRGKAAVGADMQPGPEVARLESIVDRMVEEGDVVVAEGTVIVSKKDGKAITVRFCTLFEFEHSKIRKISAYTVVV